MSRLVVGPFNRVEGDLEVTLDVDGGVVRGAEVCAPLYRGFEQILEGKAPSDALVFVPRICGICSVSQSMAASLALAEAMGIRPPDNGRHAANLVTACENLADHITHFYLFFAPDFARAAYADRPWFDGVAARWKAQTGTATAELLPARARLLELMGLCAGRWPHTLALQPGGSTRAITRAEKLHLGVLLREARAFLERTLFGDALEHIAALGSVAELSAWRAARSPEASDFARFLHVAEDLRLDEIGRGSDLFLSYGAYPTETGARLFPAGVFDGRRGALLPLDPATITEDTTSAWMAGAGASEPRHPSVGMTLPLPDKAGAYTFCKAPRLGGRVAEVGALARQAVAGHALSLELIAARGGSVLARVVARLVEVARLLPEMERTVRALEPDAPFCHTGAMPDEASGVGLTEAARGSLGHWLTVRRGRLAGYQIVAPTTWNFSPRDRHGTPGPLEQALVGVPVEGPRGDVAVQHVVRSFDPCMVCTVH